MNRARFSTKLENEFIELFNVTDVIRYSFLVQNSISHLNLDLCEYSDVRNLNRSVWEVANDFVSTEEKCRKIFKPSRSLFYNLHLDLPTGRENSLKNDLPSPLIIFNRRPEHIAKIEIYFYFYYHIILASIEWALIATNQPLTILGIFLKSPFLKKYIFHVDIHVMNKFIDCFYPKISDSSLFKGFIEIFELKTWMLKYEKPEILEFLLYHSHLQGKDIEDRWRTMCHIINNCIYLRYFLNIKPCLKLADTPGFCFNAYEIYIILIKELRPNLTDDVFSKAKELLAPKRIYFILQVLWMYIEGRKFGCGEAASEALRLLWSSSPDPYISLEEVEIIFVGALPGKEIEDMYEFYCNSIGETPSNICPRTLQQLSRTTIRRFFKQMKLWIPEGIAETGLPTKLQSFLNLEEFIPKLDL